MWTSSQSFDNAVVSGVQFAVAIASNLPELGSVGNGINAAVSLARGNYKEAGLYSGAAVASAFGVPGAGAGVKALEAVEAVAAAEEISQGTALIDEAAQAATLPERDFFLGTKYTDKVISQMKQGDFHAFPESVEGFQEAGQESKLVGGDGVIRDMLKIPGGYRGREGVFEFIKEADGSINHRLFKPHVETK